MQLNDFLDDLNRRIGEAFAQSPAKDLERNIRSMLNAGFAKLDLVTREEFDVQVELLARTREKLAELEQRLAALEKD